jgi:hypothetical protein
VVLRRRIDRSRRHAGDLEKGKRQAASEWHDHRFTAPTGEGELRTGHSERGGAADRAISSARTPIHAD